ncbi:MAG: Xaa-Pro peptidase family protein [Selenomonadaceae bacterium]|nr:Xaa-Pro peptidase family protein [Selenomonadaceae bacterium]
MISDRMKHLRDFLLDQGIPAVLISKDENVHYFSGFRGDSTMLLVTADKAFIVTDFRYVEQAQQQAPLYELVEQKEGLIKRCAELAKNIGADSVSFEGSVLSFDEYSSLAKELQPIKAEKSVSLDGLREIKEAEEIVCIEKACDIGDEAFEDIIKFIRPGMSEREVAARLENTMRCLGSEEVSFTTIVASGKRGSLPHGIATDKLISDGEFVTMDYGAVYRGYHSDVTRTVCVGTADEKQREIYSAVLSAQEIGVSLVKPGASGIEVDRQVRLLLDKAGYAKYFGHGLGHSVGLEIHEEPRLSPKSKCESLGTGTVITVEPGVYIPDWGGVRIEDTVLVTETGARRLTKSSKKLLEIKAN